MAKLLKRGASGGLLHMPTGNTALMAAPTPTCCCGATIPTCECCGHIDEIAITIGGVANATVPDCTDCADYNDDWVISGKFEDGRPQSECEATITATLPTGSNICDSGAGTPGEIACDAGLTSYFVIYRYSGDSYLRIYFWDTNNEGAIFEEVITYADCETGFGGAMTRISSDDNECDYTAMTVSVTSITYN